MMDDHDPVETQEWVDSIKAVLHYSGPERVRYLLRVRRRARRHSAAPRFSPRTRPTEHHPAGATRPSPTGTATSSTASAPIIRWNAMAIILRANKDSLRARRPHRQLPVGGDAVRHRLRPLLARAHRQTHGGDLLFIQGHSSPGIYARAFLEGRLTEEQLLNYRQETGGTGMSVATRTRG